MSGSGRRLAGAAAVVLAILVAGVLALSAVAGWFLTHPGKKPLLPADARLGVGPAYEEVVFPSRKDRLELRGWFMPAAPGSGATVIMAHGYGNNREMADLPGLAVAGALVDAGFNVLMFDFRNAGESAGTLTSVGQFEQRDLLGALDYVCGRGAGEWVGLLAYSMGAVPRARRSARALALPAAVTRNCLSYSGSIGTPSFFSSATAHKW